MRITTNVSRRRLWIGPFVIALAMTLTTHPASANPPADTTGNDLVSLARLGLPVMPGALVVVLGG